MLPDSLRLTPAQARIWRAIADYILEHGYPPSSWELMDMTGHSTSVVNRALETMAAKGYVKLAEKNGNGNRPARSYQLLVWPMELAQGVPEYTPVLSSAPEALEERRKPRRKFVRREAELAPRTQPRPKRAAKKPKVVATSQKPQPIKAKERPSWWYKTVDHALAAELDVKPRTLRVILGLGAKTVHEAAMLLKTHPAQVRNLGIEQDLRQALEQFEQLKVVRKAG